MKNFCSFGLSYNTCTLEIREKFSFTEAEAKKLMYRVREFFNIDEFLVLSTCNRSEFYYVPNQSVSVEDLIRLVLIEKGIFDENSVSALFTVFSNPQETIRRLFEVSAGLHSSVIGDLQITAQIKKAYQWSSDIGMAGPFLHRLMHTIFYTNKRIAQQTHFRNGAASTSYAASELVELVSNKNKAVPLLLVGLGEIGQSVLSNLVDKGFSNITVTNRSEPKAKELSETFQCRYTSWETLFEEVAKSAIIISSISCEYPLFTKDKWAGFTSPVYKFFIDLSVPRSIAPDLEDLPGYIVYNIDSINSQINVAKDRRRDAVPQVHSIIEESLSEFENWCEHLTVSSTLQKLKSALEEIQKKEMARHVKSLTDSDSRTIELVTASILQKVLNLPALQLKAACKRGEAEQMALALRDLFDLKSEEVCAGKHSFTQQTAYP